MSLILQPAHVPLAFVEIGGMRYPAFINPPWQKQLGTGLSAAISGASQSGPVPVVVFDDGCHDDPMPIPGPRGPAGPVQTQVVMLINEEYVGDDCFWPPR